MIPLIKESCEYCRKSICVGQAITECSMCSAVIHTKCFKKSEFVFENNTGYCFDCYNFKYVPCYNPYKIPMNEFCKQYDADHEEKFYNENPTDFIDTLQIISNTLDNCTSFESMNDANRSSIFAEQDKLSAMFLNIDGNKSNFDEFVVLLKQLKHKFPVIGLAETNISPELKNLYPIEGYTSYYQDPKPGKRKGTGVALYVDNSLNAVINDTLSICSANMESLFIDVNFGENKLNFGVIYRPPDGSEIEFLEEFKNLLDIMPPKNVFIMGDFNFDLLKLDNEPSRNFEDIILTSKFSPLISTYTHFKPNCRKTLIDNILTNTPESIIASGTIHESVSHHHPVFYVGNYSTQCNADEIRATPTYYDFSNENIAKFVTEIGVELESINDSSLTFSKFFDQFNTTLDKACKLDKPKFSKRNNKVNPWITNGIINSVKHKRTLYNNWRKTKSKKLPDGDPTVHKTFTDYRRNLKHIIRDAKSNYYCTKINEHEGDVKKTWSIINEIRGKRKVAMKPEFIIDNQKVIERRIIANEFNKYFVSVAGEMNDKIDNSSPNNETSEPDKYFSKSCPNSIFLQDCTAHEISEIISEFDNGKSSDIPIRVIKAASPVICPILEQLYNHHIQSGVFPDELKTGKISPIFKKGNPQFIENYRPISTLAIFGKIFEK